MMDIFVIELEAFYHMHMKIDSLSICIPYAPLEITQIVYDE